MILKDRVKSDGGKPSGMGNQNRGNGNTGNHFNKSHLDACKRFNKGLCTTGRACHYDHRCLECGKFGHGAHICSTKVQGGPFLRELEYFPQFGG